MSGNVGSADQNCSPDRGVDGAFHALFFLMASVSFNILIKSHWRQLLPMTAVSAITTIVNVYTEAPLGSSASAVVSAFMCGVSANIYSRLTGNPAIIGVLSGLLMLVPGSIAVRGFNELFKRKIGDGLSLVATVLVNFLI